MSEHRNSPTSQPPTTSVVKTPQTPFSVVRPNIRAMPHGSFTPLSEGPLTSDSDMSLSQATSLPRSQHLRRYQIDSPNEGPLTLDSDMSLSQAASLPWSRRQYGYRTDSPTVGRLQDPRHTFSDSLHRTSVDERFLDGLSVVEENRRLQTENHQMYESVTTLNRHVVDIESRMLEQAEDFKNEAERWERERRALVEANEKLSREKWIAEQKLTEVVSERDTLKLCMSRLPTTEEFEKVNFELLAKKQEFMRSEAGRQTLALELQKATSKCKILSNDLEVNIAHNNDLASDLAKERSRSEQLVRFRSLAESSDVESVLAEYDGLKEQNEALKKFCSSMEQLILKLKNDLKKCVEEKSTVMAENAKLESDLADSSRLTEFLREQVTNRIAERDQEREKSSGLRQELYFSRASNNGARDVAKLQQKLLVDLSVAVARLQALLEAESQLRQGTMPDTGKIVGYRSDFTRASIEELNPENVVGKLEEMAALGTEMKKLNESIERLRKYIWDACAEMLSNQAYT